MKLPSFSIADWIRDRPSIQRVLPAAAAVVVNVVISRSHSARATAVLERAGFACTIDRDGTEIYEPEVVVRVERESSQAWQKANVERLEVHRVMDLLASENIAFRIVGSRATKLPEVQSKRVLTPEQPGRATVLYSSEQEKDRALKLMACQLKVESSALKFRPDLSSLNETRLPFLGLWLVYLILSVLAGFLPDKVYIAVFLSIVFILGSIGLFMARGRGLLRPALQQSAILITVGAALTYALVRYIYVRYYQPFHVSPEEIGLDYRAILSQQFPYIVRRWAQLIGLVLAVYALFRIVAERSRVRSILVGIGLSALLVGISIVWYTDDVREAGEAGQNVSHGAIDNEAEGPFSWPPLFRALVDRTGSEGPSAYVPTSSNLIYLGSSQGVMKFLDADTTATIHLPNGAYAVRSYRTGRVLNIRDNKFRVSILRVPAQKSFTVDVINDDQQPGGPGHNIIIQGLGVNRELANRRNSVLVPKASPGGYDFYCRYHKSTMKGKLIVEKLRITW
jgi:plastocyanin